MTAATLTTFFGWMLVFNAIVLAIAALAIMAMRPWIMGIHSRLTGVDVDALPTLYFQYMANYKIAVIVLNLAPYVALRIIA
ncbi:MAG: DUF6868 family protein [Pseudomonadota bacterium]